MIGRRKLPATQSAHSSRKGPSTCVNPTSVCTFMRPDSTPKCRVVRHAADVVSYDLQDGEWASVHESREHERALMILKACLTSLLSCSNIARHEALNSNKHK